MIDLGEMLCVVKFSQHFYNKSFILIFEIFLDPD